MEQAGVATESPEEYEATLRRAFVDGKADYIIYDDRRQGYLWRCKEWAQQQGWLDDGEFVEIEEQYSQLRFRLTLDGKRHFKLPEW